MQISGSENPLCKVIVFVEVGVDGVSQASVDQSSSTPNWNQAETQFLLSRW